MIDDGTAGMAAPRIDKRFVRAGGRVVHYRVAGDGPAVVMLHDSPRSSRLHMQTMQHLANSFRVFALDTPGYGNSAPLEGDHFEIADFAQALDEVIIALGLAGAPLYATHTSAKIALHYAAETAAPCLLLLALRPARRPLEPGAYPCRRADHVEPGHHRLRVCP